MKSFREYFEDVDLKETEKTSNNILVTVKPDNELSKILDEKQKSINSIEFSIASSKTFKEVCEEAIVELKRTLNDDTITFINKLTIQIGSRGKKNQRIKASDYEIPLKNLKITNGIEIETKTSKVDIEKKPEITIEFILLKEPK